MLQTRLQCMYFYIRTHNCSRVLQCHGNCSGRLRCTRLDWITAVVSLFFCSFFFQPAAWSVSIRETNKSDFSGRLSFSTGVFFPSGVSFFFIYLSIYLLNHLCSFLVVALKVVGSGLLSGRAQVFPLPTFDDAEISFPSTLAP